MSADEVEAEGFDFYVDDWCDTCSSSPCQCRPVERLDEDACRRLAEAVVTQAVHDLAAPGRVGVEARAFFAGKDARAWIRWADADPDRFLSGLRRAIGRGLTGRGER